jgi:hypothetical protein
MNKVLLAISFLALASLTAAAEQGTPKSNPSDIRVVVVEPTPEGDHIETKIIHPRDNDVERSNPVDVLIRLIGYPLRTYSQFPRAKEVLNYNKTGQSLHVFIDNEPYFIQNEAIVNALQPQDNVYYQQVLDFKIPFNLKPGQHLLRVFPARSFGESLKGDGCFAMRLFFESTQEPKLDFDPNGPFLTYNQPQGEIAYAKSKPVLLDFYITNAQLSRDGYKVRVTIDDIAERVLTRWTPYYVYGLKEGKHTFKLELLDESNTVVPGMTNSITRTITLK